MSPKNKAVPVFFCIPDLTGFTKFMTSADVSFTQTLIPAILRKLIRANQLEMDIAEIEGDAIFFYRRGRLPSINKVAQQCKIFYKEFNDCIASFQTSEPENYAKYLADRQLGLKIIIHYGKIGITSIEGRTKLLGEDVILVHKLLKNRVEEFNYILLTDQYLKKIQDKKNIKSWFNWDKLRRGKEIYEYFGETTYAYIPLNDVLIC